MIIERILVYRFFDLARVTQEKIARKLGLCKPKDGMFEWVSAQFQNALIARALKADVLADLWDCIEQEHNDQKYPENPFRSRYNTETRCRYKELMERERAATAKVIAEKGSYA